MPVNGAADEEVKKQEVKRQRRKRFTVHATDEIDAIDETDEIDEKGLGWKHSRLFFLGEMEEESKSQRVKNSRCRIPDSGAQEECQSVRVSEIHGGWLGG